jgi:hypothetical protein
MQVIYDGSAAYEQASVPLTTNCTDHVGSDSRGPNSLIRTVLKLEFPPTEGVRPDLPYANNPPRFFFDLTSGNSNPS